MTGGVSVIYLFGKTSFISLNINLAFPHHLLCPRIRYTYNMTYIVFCNHPVFN